MSAFHSGVPVKGLLDVCWLTGSVEWGGGGERGRGTINVICRKLDFSREIGRKNSEILQLLAGEQIDGRTNKQKPYAAQKLLPSGKKNKPRRKRHRCTGSPASHGRWIPRWKSVNGYKGQVSLALGQLA